MKEVPAEAAAILVHDAARPLLPEEVIGRVLEPLGEGWDGAVPTMAVIFISYASATAVRAQQVVEALRGLGYTVWRDDELPAHRTYSDVIEERLSAGFELGHLVSHSRPFDRPSEARQRRLLSDAARA